MNEHNITNDKKDLTPITKCYGSLIISRSTSKAPSISERRALIEESINILNYRVSELYKDTTRIVPDQNKYNAYSMLLTTLSQARRHSKYPIDLSGIQVSSINLNNIYLKGALNLPKTIEIGLDENGIYRAPKKAYTQETIS